LKPKRERQSGRIVEEQKHKENFFERNERRFISGGQKAYSLKVPSLCPFVVLIRIE
jgi:hypothetical protein